MFHPLSAMSVYTGRGKGGGWHRVDTIFVNLEFIVLQIRDFDIYCKQYLNCSKINDTCKNCATSKLAISRLSARKTTWMWYDVKVKYRHSRTTVPFFTYLSLLFFSFFQLSVFLLEQSLKGVAFFVRSIRLESTCGNGLIPPLIQNPSPERLSQPVRHESVLGEA